LDAGASLAERSPQLDVEIRLAIAPKKARGEAFRAAKYAQAAADGEAAGSEIAHFRLRGKQRARRELCHKHDQNCEAFRKHHEKEELRSALRHIGWR
jgi:hypothetical protein